MNTIKFARLILLPNLYLTNYILGLNLGLSKSKSSGASKTTGTSRRSGTANKSTTNRQTNRQTGTKSTTGTSQRSGSTSSQESGKQDLSSLVSNLDAGTQEQLQEIIKSIGSPSDIKAISGSLSERALNADKALAGNTQAALDVAERRGKRSIGQSQTSLSKAAGSTQNSLVQQIGLEADTNLQVELAGLESTLNAANRRQSTEELQGALAGQTSSITDVANILKGATQQTTQQTNTTKLSSALQDLLQTSSSTEVQDLLSELLGTSKSKQTISERASSASSTNSSSKGTNVGLGGVLGL